MAVDRFPIEYHRGDILKASCKGPRQMQVVEDSGTNRFWFEKMNFAKQFDLQNYECDLVNSCNGLVCLSGVQEGSIYVCNPVLGEYITIPVPDDYGRYNKSFALGFNVRTNEFKVLHTFKVLPYLLEAEIYTLGTGSWRSIGNALGEISSLSF